MTKVSVKSVIEAGLEKGSSIKVILGQIKKKCPDSKADESHIRFYANKMVRDGKMKVVEHAVVKLLRQLQKNLWLRNQWLRNQLLKNQWLRSPPQKSQ